MGMTSTPSKLMSLASAKMRPKRPFSAPSVAPRSSGEPPRASLRCMSVPAMTKVRFGVLLASHPSRSFSKPCTACGEQYTAAGSATRLTSSVLPKPRINCITSFGMRGQLPYGKWSTSQSKRSMKEGIRRVRSAPNIARCPTSKLKRVTGKSSKKASYWGSCGTFPTSRTETPAYINHQNVYFTQRRSRTEPSNPMAIRTTTAAQAHCQRLIANRCSLEAPKRPLFAANRRV
mmetsp:Transcript_77564/g.251103  ORF Transcript_77564/g.251103 Transcript_77564/m.251103 type:complete len:232 (+) Transcript_77564:668-1363(+)